VRSEHDVEEAGTADSASLMTQDLAAGRKSNDVPRHLSTVSRDIAVVRRTGFEPRTQ
jgi:hypothetical protein